MPTSLLSVLLLASALLPCQVETTKPFQIAVVDDRTGRGVPLVELKTVNDIAHFTDSNGIVAFHEPGLMGKDVFFHVSSHGYEFAKDGFGFRGKALRVEPGGKAKLEIRRINLAERLYRVTGAGIYRDSVLTGQAVPLREPLLNGLVTGSDSVVSVVHRGKIFWFWGDTNRPSYPLGNFQVPGATSKMPGQGGLDASVGVDFDYFVDAKGFAKETARMPGKGPTWITSLVVLPDAKGMARIYAAYVKVEPPLTLHARGFAVFDEDKQEFKHVAEASMKDAAFPMGHPLRHRDDGVDYVYFAHPLPLTRVRAEGSQFLRTENYETFTCLKEGSRLEKPTLNRDEQGKLRYAWRKDTPAVGPAEENKLLKAGRIQPHEMRWQLRDRDTGKRVEPHSGSVAWNEHRRRWVLIVVQVGGTSQLGEVWLAEADTPTGPWGYAVKVATHERYSFYNPKHHTMFDKDKGRILHFEGTYTHTFSGNPHPTPRYEYNQMMYQLDLADPRTALPVAFYPRKTPDRFGTIHDVGATNETPAFFALDRPIAGSVPIVADDKGLHLGKKDAKSILFHALPADAKPSASTTALYEYRNDATNERAYSIDAKLAMPGYPRVEAPLCRVWRP